MDVKNVLPVVEYMVWQNVKFNTCLFISIEHSISRLRKCTSLYYRDSYSDNVAKGIQYVSWYVATIHGITDGSRGSISYSCEIKYYSDQSEIIIFIFKLGIMALVDSMRKNRGMCWIIKLMQKQTISWFHINWPTLYDFELIVKIVRICNSLFQ